MADLKDLKQAILEIPKLVESLKKQKLASEKPRAEIQTADGLTLYYEGDALQPGISLMILEGNVKKVCPDGEYTTHTQKITVKYGKVIHVQPASMYSGFAAIKPQEKSHVTIKKEDSQSSSSFEFKALQESFEKKLASQKEHFEQEINALKKSFNAQAAELKASAESQNQTLKEMFDLIDRISKSPALPSDFKKKDGEPSQKPKNVFEEAKALSQKVFPN